MQCVVHDMVFDLTNPASVRAWLAQRPDLHRAQLAVLLRLPLWARWRRERT
jgi:hypothetical protein